MIIGRPFLPKTARDLSKEIKNIMESNYRKLESNYKKLEFDSIFSESNSIFEPNFYPPTKFLLQHNKDYQAIQN